MVFALGGLYCSALFAQTVFDNQKIDGYRGIWFTLGQYSKYGDKYSGGLGTYTAKHRPLAIYSAESNKTFFVYGGTTQRDEKRLLCMISYYAQTKDRGKTWTTIDGEKLKLPLTTIDCGARVVDYAKRRKNVYLKDLNFDRAGNPICLYVTSDGHEPGPQNGPREWWVTRLINGEWTTRLVCSSDHNYDMGSLYVERSRWVVIAPTAAGPQPHQSGGEVVRWVSEDSGMSWERAKAITRDSPRNHNYVRRPVSAQDPFYSFWADGDPAEFSESRLYFSNSDGSEVYQLPYNMNDASEEPIRIIP